DYLEFKSRFILEPRDGVHRDFWGAMGFGNLFPPHTGSSAGLAEALGAGLRIKEARGEDASRWIRQLRQMGAFLLRQQLSARACFFCDSEASGGFTGDQISVVG